MRKNQGLLIGILAIVIAAYNAVVFMLVDSKTEVFWISYIFTMLSFLLMVAVYFLSVGKQPKMTFLGLPLVSLSMIYLPIQLILGIIFMCFPHISVKPVLIVEIILLALYLIVALSTLMAKNYVSEIEAHQARKTFYIRSLADDLLSCANNCTDETFKRKILALQSSVSYSDPMSHETLAVIEENLVQEAKALRSKVDALDYDSASLCCNQIEKLLDERNRKCKLLK